MEVINASRIDSVISLAASTTPITRLMPSFSDFYQGKDLIVTNWESLQVF
jgi:hypothetical protein